MDLLDELLGVLTADEDLARVTEREVGRVGRRRRRRSRNTDDTVVHVDISHMAVRGSTWNF
jgi:hypothetical protein